MAISIHSDTTLICFCIEGYFLCTIFSATIFLKQMFGKAVLFIKDIIKEEGIMSYSQIIQVHGRVCNPQQYTQLTGSLPQQWKRKVNSIAGSHSVCRPSIKQTR